MTARHDQTRAVVIDLRTASCDVEQVEGPVLVLDNAETAAEHDQVYQALLGSPRVSGVICLAVDGGTSNGSVRVRPAPSLAPVEDGATLWVGDHYGIRWRPDTPAVRAVPHTEPSSLNHLIDALAEPVVFDAVVKAVSTLPHSTASVGMTLERASLHGAELRRARDEAIIELTDPDAGRAVARELPRGEFRDAVRAVIDIDSAEDVLIPDAPLAAAHARAVEALDAADHEITRLDNWLAPLSKQRPGRVVGALVDEARSAARDFHETATRQLRRINDNLRGQRVTREVVTQQGVRGPTPAHPRKIRNDIRHLVEEWLPRYRSIAHLLPDLDAAKVEQAPQGCLRALDEVETLRPPIGPSPAFTIFRRPWSAALLTGLTVLLAVLGVAPEIVAGCLAVAWFAVGLLLHARQPTAASEVGFVKALIPTLWSWGMPGAVAWLLALIEGESPVPAPWNAALTVLALLTFVAAVGICWRWGVRRWRRELNLGGLRAKITRIDHAVDTVLRTEWRPSAQRMLFSDGLLQVSEGLSAIQDLLTGRAGDLFTVPARQYDGEPNGAGGSDSPPDRDVYQEVRDVVVTDLVDLTIAALRPCWAGIEVGRSVDRSAYTEPATNLLTRYEDHVTRHGLLPTPPFASQRVHREALATKLWASSRVAHALSRGVEDEMTQLGHAGQLGALSALASGARLVQFAPTAVRGLTGDATRPGPIVTWTGDAEIAGTLRLVPLRQGVFE